MLTTFESDLDVYRAMQAGARGCLLKGMEAEELIAAIRFIEYHKQHSTQTQVGFPRLQNHLQCGDNCYTEKEF